MLTNSLIDKYNNNTAWRLSYRPMTGLCIETQGGMLLARVADDPPRLVFWDRHAKRELDIDVETMAGWFTRG